MGKTAEVPEIPATDTARGRTTVPAEEDHALKSILSLIERDLEKRPEAIRPVNRDLYRRAAALVDGVAVDLDAPLAGDEGMRWASA